MRKRVSRPVRSLLVTLLVGGGGMVAVGASSSDPKIDPDAAGARHQIERMMTALGGRDAIEGLRSLSVEAECTGPGGDFRTRVDSFRPAAVHFRQQADEGITEVWSTADATWRRTGDGTLETIAAAARSFLRAHEFHLLILEVEERFSDHRLRGTDRVGDRDCGRIEMTDAAGQPASLCIAAADALPLELVMSPEGAEGSLRIVFDDWRDVEGIRYFHSFVLREGPDRVFTYAYETIAPDSVSALAFVPPAAAELQREQEALVEILRRDRRAHLETDASLLSAGLADRLIDVSAGEVRTRGRDELEAAFRSYFDGASYEIWEDTRPPTIRLSGDAAMAWVVRAVRVERLEPGEDGETVRRRFTSAYTSTYEKQQGEWRMTSVTSTFPPSRG